MNTQARMRNWLLFILIAICFVVLLIWGWPRLKPYLSKENKSNVTGSLDLQRQQEAMLSQLKAFCSGKKEEAATKAKEFCRTNDILCGNNISFAASGGLSGVFDTLRPKPIGSHWENSYKLYGTIPVRFDFPEKNFIVFPDVSLTFDCQGDEIVEYRNNILYDEYLINYGGRVPGEAKWPRFMPKKKAEKIIDGISSKLTLPKDMVLDGMVQNRKMGVWTAFWIRSKDGFRYEDDWAALAIMGATGEFVAYHKHYRMGPCPTTLIVKRQEAISQAEALLEKKLPEEAKRAIVHISEVYEANADALIIQADRFRGPGESLFDSLSKENSRLAWVIRFHFTGGLKYPVNKNPYGTELTAAEDASSRKYVEEMTLRWQRFGYPPQQYEVRIDAETGKIIYEGNS